MCLNKTIEFSGCRHKWPQYLKCDDVKKGEKCRKVRQGTEVYHQECPRCDPGYSARTNTEPIEGLRLIKSVQELQKAAARAIEIERYEAYDSKASGRGIDKDAKRTSGNSLSSDDGGIKSKFRGMLGKGLDRMGTRAKKENSKSSNTRTVHGKQRSDGNEKYDPALSLARKPTTFIMRDKDGRFHDPRNSEDALAGHLVRVEDRQGLRDCYQERVLGTSVPIVRPEASTQEVWRSDSRRHIPDHSLSYESGKAESATLAERWGRERGQTQNHEQTRSLELENTEIKVLQEMWLEERAQMQSPEGSLSPMSSQYKGRISGEMWGGKISQKKSPEPLNPYNPPPQWPRRQQSQKWSRAISYDERLGFERPLSHSDKGLSRPGTFPGSESPMRQPEMFEENTIPGTTSLTAVAHRPADRPEVPQSAFETLRMEKENIRLFGSRLDAPWSAEAGHAGRKSTRTSGEQAQGKDKSQTPLRGDSDNWDDLSPAPLRTSHHKKPSVDVVLENTAIDQPKHLNDWERYGVDYLEEHCDTSLDATHSKSTHLNGRGNGETREKELPGISKDLERWPKHNVSSQENITLTNNGHTQLDEKGVHRELSRTSQTAIVTSEHASAEKVGYKFTPDSGPERPRKAYSKRGPLPKRKTSRERNFVEALQRADERLRSVRDKRGYIDFNFI